MTDVQKEGEILLYKTDDGITKIDVRLKNETVWLSLNQMAELFDRDKSVIAKHIKNAFEEGEIEPNRTVANFATVQKEGSRSVQRDVEHFNLDVIISVGYRVKSKRGAQFRIWATQRLKEYLIKGFTMDDERLKLGGNNYFDELLSRIRDIRSSERVFWRKVLDIYATSIDYDANTEVSTKFFKTVQNKIHWAAHGKTAAEVISQRADAKQPNMGLTSWSGAKPKKSDASIAKNYLAQDELSALNLIVSAYLDFAELQAQGKRAMYMKDWISKLDDFLKLSERDILNHAGKVSHDDAMKKAELEYEKYQKLQSVLPTQVDDDFDKAISEVKKLGPGVKRNIKPRKGPKKKE